MKSSNIKQVKDIHIEFEKLSLDKETIQNLTRNNPVNENLEVLVENIVNNVIFKENPLFNLHLNIPISDAIIDLMKNFPGVDAFEVISPYKAVISFGRLFKATEMQQNIKKCFSEFARKNLQLITGQQVAQINSLIET